MYIIRLFLLIPLPKYKRVFLKGFTLCFFVLYNCSGENSENKNVNIFCASGLSEYITEIKDSTESRSINTVLNIASSGILATQINNGIEADLFISASRKWVEFLDSSGYADTIVEFASNKLVFIVSNQYNFSTMAEALKNAKRISSGNPEFVPAGEYTKETLISLNNYKQTKDKLIYTSDVKSALKLVEMGECEGGFVYISDAMFSKKVKITDTIADSLHSPINFYLVKIKNLKSNGTIVFNYLLSDESKTILKKSGIKPGN